MKYHDSVTHKVLVIIIMNRTLPAADFPNAHKEKWREHLNRLFRLYILYTDETVQNVPAEILFIRLSEE